MTHSPDASRGSDLSGGSSGSASPSSVRQPYRPPPAPRVAPPPGRRRLSPAQGTRLGLYAMVVIVLGTAGGLAVTLLMPTKYAARTDIEYNVSVENASDFLRTDRNLTTQAVLLTDPAVLAPVAQANGIDEADLEDDVTATLVTANSVNSEIIQVDVLNPDRGTGIKLAAAIAQQYLTVVKAASPAAYIQGQLDQARTQLLSATTAATQATLQARVAQLQGQLDTVNISGNRAAVVVPAYSVPGRAEPNPKLAAAAGGLFGVVLAGLMVIGLSRRWTRS